MPTWLRDNHEMKPQIDELGESATRSWRVLLSSRSVWHELKSSAGQTEDSLQANALLAIPTCSCIQGGTAYSGCNDSVQFMNRAQSTQPTMVNAHGLDLCRICLLDVIHMGIHDRVEHRWVPSKPWHRQSEPIHSTEVVHVLHTGSSTVEAIGSSAVCSTFQGYPTPGLIEKHTAPSRHRCQHRQVTRPLPEGQRRLVALRSRWIKNIYFFRKDGRGLMSHAIQMSQEEQVMTYRQFTLGDNVQLGHIAAP